MTVDAANGTIVAGFWRELPKVSLDDEVKATARGLVRWDHGWRMLPDLAALAELAKFDLNLPRKRPLL